MTDTESSPPLRAGECGAPPPAILTGLGVGLIAGWLELASVVVQRAIDPRITMDSLLTSRHFVWMIPVFDLLTFCAVALLVRGLARFLPGLARVLEWRLYVALAALAVSLTVPGLYPAACVLLACGIGNVLGPRAGRLAGRFERPFRAIVAVLAVGLVVLTVGWYSRVVTAERRALARLGPASPTAPNVLFIVLDNVRAASMSLYGHDRPTTPNLDRLARRGVCFTAACSTAPWTLPSHASMFTGQWGHKLSVSWDRALDATYPTLAEYLAGRGYATAGFVGNNFYGNARYGLDRGFARYEDFYENQRVSPFEVIRNGRLGRGILAALGYPVRYNDTGSSIRKTAEMLNRDVLGWLSERPTDRPFFVFLNYFDAHAPFVPPAGPDPRFGLCALPRAELNKILLRGQRLLTGKLTPADGPRQRVNIESTTALRDSYESCIAYLDRQVGRLFDSLERRGALRNTLVIVTSDHGEHFQEHGFLGHGLSLYRREVHVPLLIFPPSPIADRAVVSEPVSLRELTATVVDQLGVGDRSPFPGRSLARYWTAEAADPSASRAPLLSEVGHHLRFQGFPGIPSGRGPVKSVVSEGRVYIRNGDGGEELYDFLGDPLEVRNLADSAAAPSILNQYRGVLDRLLRDDGRTPSDVLATSTRGEPSRRERR